MNTTIWLNLTIQYPHSPPNQLILTFENRITLLSLRNTHTINIKALLTHNYMEKREEGYNTSDSGNWNVAADYSKLKIMRPLFNCDAYENIAKFGYDSFTEELAQFSLPNETLRLMGMDRLINELLKLIQNAKFAMKAKKTKEELEGYEKTLTLLLQLTPKLSTVKVNQLKRTKVTVIHEKVFNMVLKKVLEVKSKINEPLNKNDLIFTSKEEFDPVAYKKLVFDRATTRG